MSWLGGYNPSNNKPSESELREERRQKLEADRQQRKEQRDKRLQELEQAIQSQREADQAFREFLDIAEDIFDEEDFLSDTGSMAVNFDIENSVDGDKAIDKLNTVVCPFDKDDIEYWFSELEMQLALIDVKSQWLKRLAVQRFLPVEIRHEVRDLMLIQKADAGNDIYKKIKTELIDLFGAKPEDCYTRAKNRVLTGKPSQLGKALLNDLCKKSKKLDGCCCADIVWGMYRENLPVVVRNHVAEMHFNKDTYKDIFTTSDKVFDSNQSAQPVRGTTVAAVAASNPSASPDSEVAAMAFRKNKKPNNNKGGGAQNKAAPAASPTQNQNSSAPRKGTRHATARGADDKLCKIHFKWGTSGKFCAAPWKCPMKDVIQT